MDDTIVGMSMADIGLLVVDSTVGDNGSDDDTYGVTKEHCLLLYTLGVKQIVVAITKMDDENVNFEEDQWKRIRFDIASHLKRVQYKPMAIPFVPGVRINKNLASIDEIITPRSENTDTDSVLVTPLSENEDDFTMLTEVTDCMSVMEINSKDSLHNDNKRGRESHASYSSQADRLHKKPRNPRTAAKRRSRYKIIYILI